LSDEEIVPAEPGDIPPWLEQMREQSDDEVAAVLADSVDVVEEAELPSGLFEDVGVDTGVDVSAFALDTDELSLADVDLLWAEPVEEMSEMEGPESELAAFLEGDLEPEPDALADALDAEYERKVVGDDTEPVWYTEAVAKVAADAPEVPVDLASITEKSEAEAPAEPVVAPAVPVDMPDWLKEVKVETPIVETDSIPDWLAGETEVLLLQVIFRLASRTDANS
jgi:hypothetical protein